MTRARKKYRIQARMTTNIYAFCARAAHEALKQAPDREEEEFFFAMMAGVFAAFAVEGYLNHLGQARVRTWKELERRLGPREKLLLLRDMLHLSVDLSRRPFGTLADMLRLRDSLAHGKTVTKDCDIVVSDPDEDPAQHLLQDWKTLCELRSVERMVEDAEKMVRRLCTASGSKQDPFGSLGGGCSGIQEVTTDEETGGA